MRTFTQGQPSPSESKIPSRSEVKAQKQRKNISGSMANYVPFLERKGCEARQICGQKIIGPPTDWSGPPPPRGSEVFIGNLPRDLYEDELVPLMERAGPVYLARLMMDFAGTTRGFAFVTFANPEAAQRAIYLLNKQEIRPGRHIGVYHSFDNRRLFLGNIPTTRTREEVMKEIKNQTEGVEDVKLYVSNHTKTRGYAFVRYESHRAAAIARRKLIEINGRLWESFAPVTVDWAEPELEDQTAAHLDVRVLYMRNLALCTTEDDLRKLCGNISAGIERVKKQKDYAFVHFSTREQAEAVKSSLNGHILHGCELEITWAKPVKNREEYNQRKAIAKLMVSAGQTRTGYLPHITPGGEQLMVVPQVRRAAGAQGIQHQPRSGSTRARTTETPILGIQSPAMFVPPVKNQSEILSELCSQEKWGEPQFEIFEYKTDKVSNYNCKVIIQGFPGGPAQFQTDGLSGSPDEARNVAADAFLKQLGILQNPVRSPGASARVIQNSQAYRGPPITPAQYYVAPPMNMAPIMTPSITTASPQSMAVTPGAYLVPSPALSPYDSLNPYALQSAYYQQALINQQAGLTTLERPRYTTAE